MGAAHAIAAVLPRALLPVTCAARGARCPGRVIVRGLVLACRILIMLMITAGLVTGPRATVMAVPVVIGPVPRAMGIRLRLHAVVCGPLPVTGVSEERLRRRVAAGTIQASIRGQRSRAPMPLQLLTMEPMLAVMRMPSALKPIPVILPVRPSGRYPIRVIVIQAAGRAGMPGLRSAVP